MIKLIVNADDFGYSHGVNYGILDSHLYGIVNSTTMMMNMPGTDHAIDLAKKNPSLQVGIHLVLTCGKPLLSDVPTLIDESGNFKSLSYLMEHKDFSLEDVESEWTAQIERFLTSGLQPTHFDSHHHVHTIKELLPVVQKLARKYDLPVRKNGERAIEGVKPFSDICLLDFYGETATKDYFEKIPTTAKAGIVVEVMCHPAYMDNQILKGSSYNHPRLTELEILTSIELPSGLLLAE